MLRSLFDKPATAISNFGTKYNLPDLGIGRTFSSDPYIQDQNLKPPAGYQVGIGHDARHVPYPRVGWQGLQQQPWSPPPAPMGTGSVAGVGAARVPTPQTPDFRQEITPEQDRLRQETEEREALAREAAEGIFGPLRQLAQTQMDRLPTDRAGLEAMLRAGAEGARGIVGSQLEGMLDTIGGQREELGTRTARSLRDLAESGRTTAQSLARQLGARGAGDTSATDYAAAAIGRQGMRQRGLIGESQEMGTRELDRATRESERIADQEYMRIDQDKNSKLLELANNFQNLNRQLETQMATATSDERRYIADQQMQLRDQLSQSLQALEAEVRDRKSSLDDWLFQQNYSLQQRLATARPRATAQVDPIMQDLKRQSQISGLIQGLPPAARSAAEQRMGAPIGYYDPGMLASPKDQYEDLYYTQQLDALQNPQPEPGKLGQLWNLIRN
jgi:hypothetical protein